MIVQLINWYRSAYKIEWCFFYHAIYLAIWSKIEIQTDNTRNNILYIIAFIVFLTKKKNPKSFFPINHRKQLVFCCEFANRRNRFSRKNQTRNCLKNDFGNLRNHNKKWFSTICWKKRFRGFRFVRKTINVITQSISCIFMIFIFFEQFFEFVCLASNC